ncbi:MAG: hypothetical protein JXP34_29000 [Planctomycetes bacterium]|nr:hypothetical protein [Planctomycetota bacterium]
MAESCRSWWRNCAIEADPEIRAIDRLEDAIAPLPPGVAAVRGLISTFELCHHKADRWVANILEAIAAGETQKGLGTRSPGQRHPAEEVWGNACAALSAWCAGCPGDSVDLSIGGVPASEMLAALGERSPRKEWQVQRVIERIRNLIHWPESQEDPTAQYVWILFDHEDPSWYRRQCPEHYREHEAFWRATARTMIHDTVDGEEAEMSLALAVDMLWPCHWRFVENLRIVLGAIGGRLDPETPFAACARNLTLFPRRSRMEVIARTLRAYCEEPGAAGEVDPGILARLGERTEAKRWLAASLDKTIRLQLDPPPALRALTALAGPDWIRQ